MNNLINQRPPPCIKVLMMFFFSVSQFFSSRKCGNSFSAARFCVEFSIVWSAVDETISRKWKTAKQFFSDYKINNCRRESLLCRLLTLNPFRVCWRMFKGKTLRFRSFWVSSSPITFHWTIISNNSSKSLSSIACNSAKLKIRERKTSKLAHRKRPYN